MTRLGLWLNFIGSALVGLSAYFGTVSGFGGALVWKPHWLEVVFWVGWILLTLGFLHSCGHRAKHKWLLLIVVLLGHLEVLSTLNIIDATLELINRRFNIR